MWKSFMVFCAFLGFVGPYKGDLKAFVKVTSELVCENLHSDVAKEIMNQFYGFITGFDVPSAPNQWGYQHDYYFPDFFTDETEVIFEPRLKFERASNIQVNRQKISLTLSTNEPKLILTLSTEPKKRIINTGLRRWPQVRAELAFNFSVQAYFQFHLSSRCTSEVRHIKMSPFKWFKLRLDLFQLSEPYISSALERNFENYKYYVDDEVYPFDNLTQEITYKLYQSFNIGLFKSFSNQLSEYKIQHRVCDFLLTTIQEDKKF